MAADPVAQAERVAALLPDLRGLRTDRWFGAWSGPIDRFARNR